jgi:transposase
VAFCVQLRFKEAGQEKMARRKVTVRDAGEILEHWQAGRRIRAIARSLGADRPTVRKYVAIAEAHGYRPGEPPPRQGWRAFLQEVAPEVFDPALRSKVFAELHSRHEQIKEAVAETNLMTAWQRLHDGQGLKASYSSFRRYVLEHLPGVVARSEVTVRRQDPPPGEEAQIDFGYLGLWEDPLTGKRCRLWVFAMVLSHSRHMFARAVRRMDQVAWLESHVAAFEFWGGAPARLVTDNLTSGILKADLYDPKFNRGYEELAHHYDTLIDPARAGKPRDKPRIERMVPFIRASFWAGRAFSCLEEINRELVLWCLKVAGQRIHGTTHQRPLGVFEAVERAALRPLPPEPFEIATWVKAKVGWDCYFHASGALYTAPYAYAGREVIVKLTPYLVQAYSGYELIKTHLRVGKWQRSTDWNDFPPEKAEFFRSTPERCREQAAALGEEVRKTVEALLEDHLLYHLRQIRGILRLGQKYGKERLNAACARANAFDDPCYRTVKNILERGLDRQLALAAPVVAAGAFLRGPEELLLPLNYHEEVYRG